MSRDGPGLLLRDILDGDDEQIAAIIRVITEIRPDILHLNDFDYDLDLRALTAFREALRAAGMTYPYMFSALPNSGLPTGLDMDGDGRRGGPRDAQGYGRFSGQGGMAILSTLPLGEARDFSDFPWADLPGEIAPRIDGAPFPSAAAFAAQRLSSVGHWEVPVRLPDGRDLHLLAFHATTPVFDGDEDRNGRRNRDEVMFWPLLLDNALPMPPPDGPFVILGDANLDPVDGEGRREAIDTLLTHPLVQDPAPRSRGGTAAANSGQAGDPALDTADWDDPVPGNLRVDYVLPSADLNVTGTGVFWPAPGDPLEPASRGSRHRMVWVDIGG